MCLLQQFRVIEHNRQRDGLLRQLGRLGIPDVEPEESELRQRANSNPIVAERLAELERSARMLLRPRDSSITRPFSASCW